MGSLFFYNSLDVTSSRLSNSKFFYFCKPKPIKNYIQLFLWFEDMQTEIVNKVAESGIITLNLEDFYPTQEVMLFDLKEYLFMGLILKEKDYRAALQQIDFSQFKNKIVALTCTADAIIPVWAYMLAAHYLQPFAYKIMFGDKQKAIEDIFLNNIKEAFKADDYLDKRIVVKGCGETPIPESAYITITALLKPVAKSIMYGEPCSTVPIYKKPATKIL